MYTDTAISGVNLPLRTLCLTFDDGPGMSWGRGAGPQTLPLAQYLADMGIQATFFAVGRCSADCPGIIAQIKDLGHLIGNHTFDHPIMTGCTGSALVDQVLRTDGLIQPGIRANEPIFVRPPYGAWSPAVAAALNANVLASLNHVGPIGWDIDGHDYNCWLYGIDPETCAQNYLELIQAQQRGIILMHDNTSDIPSLGHMNLTYQMVRLLIPQLMKLGYSFVRLDAIPEVIAAASEPYMLALQGANEKYVSAQDGGGGRICIDQTRISARERLRIIGLGSGRIAIQTTASPGRGREYYFSVTPGGGTPITATAASIGDYETFDVIDAGRNRISLRAFDGTYVTYNNTGGNDSILTTTTTLPSDRLSAKLVELEPALIFTPHTGIN